MLWACTLFGWSCAIGTPTISIIQSAYEREISSGSSLHDKGLRVLEASCNGGVDGRFLCQITFLLKEDPNQRLYFDVIAVARTKLGWELKSGLCKR